MTKKNCVAYAKIASFEGGQTNLNLETLVKQIVESFPDAESRKITGLFSDQYTQLADYDIYPNDDGVAIFINCHSPNNETSTIKSSSTANEDKLAKQSMRAPDGHSIIKYEIFAYIKDNKLLLVGDVVKEYVFEELINHLALKANIIKSDIKVRTSSATAVDKIKQINKYGVSQIQLNISAYAHDLEKATETARMELVKPLATLKDILSKRNASDTISSSNVSYYLTVDIKKLNKTQLSKLADGTTLDYVDEWAKKSAEGVLEDYIHDYTIKLCGKGGSIKHSELKIKRNIKVSPHGKSFDTKDMWYSLKMTYQDMCKEGIF